MQQISVNLYEPNEKQRLFYLATAKHIGFGGARGGGKSHGVRDKAKMLALRYPGIKILIVRKSYPELRRNHIQTLRLECLAIAKYVDSQKLLTFVNGSTIEFTYCDKDKDLDRLQGAEYDIIFLDEAEQLSEHQMKVIAACCRGVNDFPKRIYYTMNPGGQGHSYLKRIFIDRNFEADEDPDDYAFIQALVTDNKALMALNPDYIKQLEALPEKLKKAWLYGDWDIFEGQFFEEFINDPQHYKDGKNTHVIAPFDIPSDWNIYRSFDWGYHRPFSCGWWSVNHDGVVYRIAEYYGCTGEANEGVKLVPSEVFRRIHEIETEHPLLKGKQIRGIADPAIWDAQTGESIADTAAKHQVFFSKADNSRINGWMQFHYRLAFDKNGYPMMYVFSNCKDFIRTIPLLMYDEHKPEDLDTAGEDHIADETRYFLMSRPIAPRKTLPEDNWADNPLSKYLGIKREDLAGTTEPTKTITIIKE